MIKKNLWLLREQFGYTQEQIAEKIGVSRQTYAKWESGASLPDINQCVKISDIYNTTLDSLVNTNSTDTLGFVRPLGKGHYFYGIVAVDENCAIVIPREAIEKYNINVGEKIVVLGNVDGIELVTQKNFEIILNRLHDLIK